MVYWRVLHWWYLCALEKKCIAPPGHRYGCAPVRMLRCMENKTAVCWSGCHRYDQSAINIIYNNYLYEINETEGDYSRPFQIARMPTHLFELKEGECDREM